MPQLVTCRKCGAVLYEGGELKAPYEIIESCDGKCPNCRRRLSEIPKCFEVKPADGTDLQSFLKREKAFKKKPQTKTKKLERKTYPLS